MNQQKRNVEAVARKSGIALKPRRRGAANVTHETEVARLTRELQAALQQQTATSEVSRVMPQTVLDTY